MDTRVPLELMPDSSSVGSYGPEENLTPAYGTGFDVPYLTVDEKGRILSASTKRITLPPASEATTVSWQNITNKPDEFLPANHSSTTTNYGASSSTHYGHALASSTTPKAAGTAFAGIETSSFARGDHVHPEQTSISGNAGTATKLETARSISLTGDVSGSTSFDGSQNVSISVSSIKEVAYATTEPDTSGTASLDNESIIFYANVSAGGSSSSLYPVYTTENQVIGGVKTFASGIFKNAIVLDSFSNIIDASQASCFVKTIDAATAFIFSSVPSGVLCSVTIVLHNGGSYFIVWPQSVKWSGNETPDLTANGTDILSFMTFDGGDNWFGNVICSGVA